MKIGVLCQGKYGLTFISFFGIILAVKEIIDKKLREFLQDIDKRYSLSKLSPLLFRSIKDFVLREGKRIRPILFVTAYKGFGGKAGRGLYTCAVSLEFLHDFMLIHDDIIDRSDTRRGRPSMHKLLERRRYAKCTGQDMAIVAGDAVYAMAIDAFLNIEEKKEYKEKSLRKFVEAAIYTAVGEFEELLNETKDIEKITKKDIYKIYDLKTAYYTFACPLAMGAVLAGADKAQIDMLFKFGMCLGRAFQIRDDILGIFGEEKETGKSSFTDLQEGKKTILIWYAYNRSVKEKKFVIKKILAKKKINKGDLEVIRGIIRDTGALRYANEQIQMLIADAQKFLLGIKLRPVYKKFLLDFSKKICTYC